MNPNRPGDEIPRSFPALADSGMQGPPPGQPPYQPPPRVGAPLPGRHKPAGRSDSKSGCAIAAVIGVVVMMGMIVVIGILAAIMLPALARPREAARRASCQNNLKQMGIVYRMWANENDHLLPSLSDLPGEFAPVVDEIYPEYLTMPSVFICPSDPTAQANGESPDLIGDESYFYLGYAITNEEEAQAFIEAYRQQQASGGSFDEDLIVEAGTGTAGTDRFVRLRDNISNDLPVNPSEIPIMFDREIDQHIPGGINVLFLDGHVEFVQEGFGEFPSQRWFLDALAELER